MNDIKSLKKVFVSPKLYEQALTHRSWVNEHKNVRDTNERLEFLGDAVLEYVVSDFLYQKYPDKNEGFLTALRANIVNTINLSVVAKNLNLGRELFLSKGEEETGGRQNPSLLADTVEAVIGAIFIEKGIETAKKFIEDNIIKDIEKIAEKPLKDAKSRLQELVQSEKLPTPKYHVIGESGPDHNKNFEVQVTVGSDILGKGNGKNKSQAEQEAAKNAIASLYNHKK